MKRSRTHVARIAARNRTTIDRVFRGSIIRPRRVLDHVFGGSALLEQLDQLNRDWLVLLDIAIQLLFEMLSLEGSCDSFILGIPPPLHRDRGGGLDFADDMVFLIGRQSKIFMYAVIYHS